MTDTTTQAALPDLPDPPLRFGINISATGQRLDYSAEDMRAYATQYAASLTAERDELRAQLQWHDVRTDGPPPCDGEVVFIGINSAGYVGAFNEHSGGGCYMETAEGTEHVMGDVSYWRRHTGPAKEGD